MCENWKWTRRRKIAFFIRFCVFYSMILLKEFYGKISMSGYVCVCVCVAFFSFIILIFWKFYYIENWGGNKSSITQSCDFGCISQIPMDSLNWTSPFYLIRIFLILRQFFLCYTCVYLSLNVITFCSILLCDLYFFIIFQADNTLIEYWDCILSIYFKT